MNFWTQTLHVLGTGAIAYITAANLRDPHTRPNLLAGFQLAESGSVPFLSKLADRATAEGETWLAERLQRHAADEKRHGEIFARALGRLGKHVVAPPSRSESESASRSQPPEPRQRSPFFAAYFRGYEREQLQPEQIDWTVFLGSTYILELDASKDFARMAKALGEGESDRFLRAALTGIAGDETRHAAYLFEAMERRFSPEQVRAIVTNWRERKVEALIAMASNLLQKGGEIPSLAKDGAPVDLPPEMAPAA